MAEIKGSCLCGKVTYAASADPVFTGLCHCTACQKGTGSAFGSVLAVPSATLTVNGPTTQYDGVADSGKATHRAFCASCGSTIWRSAEVMPGLTMIEVGTLDDTSWVKPTMQIYCDSAMPWATVADLQSFPKMPG